MEGQPGYEENKTANWKTIDWTFEQLKKVVTTHKGEFDDCSFILPKLTPTNALTCVQEIKLQCRVW